MCWATPPSRRRCPSRRFRPTARPRWSRPTSLAALAKKEKFEPRYRNTCWSLLAPDDNVKVGANYAPKDGKLDPSGSFVSQRGEAADVRKQNYQESVAWYDNITAEMFAKTTTAGAAKGRIDGTGRLTRRTPAEWPFGRRWRLSLGLLVGGRRVLFRRLGQRSEEGGQRAALLIGERACDRHHHRIGAGRRRGRTSSWR